MDSKGKRKFSQGMLARRSQQGERASYVSGDGRNSGHGAPPQYQTSNSGQQRTSNSSSHQGRGSGYHQGPSQTSNSYQPGAQDQMHPRLSAQSSQQGHSARASQSRCDQPPHREADLQDVQANVRDERYKRLVRTQAEELRQAQRKIKVQDKKMEMLWEEMNSRKNEENQKKQVDVLWGEVLKRFEALNVVKQTSETKKGTPQEQDEEIFLSTCEKRDSGKQRASASSEARSSIGDENNCGTRPSTARRSEGAQAGEDDEFATDAVLSLPQGQSKDLLATIVSTMSNVDLVESRTISCEDAKDAEVARKELEDELFSELEDDPENSTKNQKTLSLDRDDDPSKTAERRASWKLARGDVKESPFQSAQHRAVGGMPVDQCLIEDLRGALDVWEEDEERSDGGSVCDEDLV